MRARGRWVKWTVGGIGALLGLACLTLAGYGAMLAASLALPKSDEHPPLLIYGAPFLLKPGVHVVESGLLDRLHRLGYQAVPTVRAPGDYAADSSGFELFLRAQDDTHIPARHVRLDIIDGVIANVLSVQEQESLPFVLLEPPLLSGMRGSSRQLREWIPYSQIPPDVIKTVLAVEDRRFFSHYGIDPVAVGRAFWANVTRGGVVQGGSTITQQLAKNLFYSPQRTLTRKVREVVAALVMECKYRKEEILESYLNEIYLGQAGSVSIYGVGEAAHRYFGKPLGALSIEEVALIAGLIKGPNAYSPVKNLELATQRRNVVLRRLREEGLLSDEAWMRSVNRPVQVALPEDVLPDAPYFVDYLLRQVEEGTGLGIPEGARLYSTLDAYVQQLATEALRNGLAKLERTYPALKEAEPPLQGAVVVLEARTGHVLAMVGGREYRTSQFNRAVQARRQAGSLFKPFVYLAGFEASREAGAAGLTPATLLADEPMTFDSGAGPWSPQNYDRQFHGQVTVRAALEQSLNIPAVRAAQLVGMATVNATLRRFGLQGALPENLSVALGSASVSLLEITSAYGGLAHEGVVARPVAVTHLARETGETVWSPVLDRQQAASAQAAYLITSLLQGVIDRGTGVKARGLGLRGPVAGKTGTTDGYHDAWFVGYTPELVIGVWVGFDDERPIRLTGSQAALPIWVDLARRLIPEDAPDFEVATGIVSRPIDPRTGQLATSQCPERVTEVFREGTEPTVLCEVHGSGLWDRLKQTFGFL
ncbi:MAG: PBP1A family penicillin-binding protein [Nitrospira sp.]|jgi:1A family penicillin-binding protein|nr:PBP1A family penicillin-binding protein [Nitrospira sp.]